MELDAALVCGDGVVEVVGAVTAGFRISGGGRRGESGGYSPSSSKICRLWKMNEESVAQKQVQLQTERFLLGAYLNACEKESSKSRCDVREWACVRASTRVLTRASTRASSCCGVHLGRVRVCAIVWRARYIQLHYWRIPNHVTCNCTKYNRSSQSFCSDLISVKRRKLGSTYNIFGWLWIIRHGCVLQVSWRNISMFCTSKFCSPQNRWIWISELQILSFWWVPFFWCLLSRISVQEMLCDTVSVFTLWLLKVQKNYSTLKQVAYQFPSCPLKEKGGRSGRGGKKRKGSCFVQGYCEKSCKPTQSVQIYTNKATADRLVLQKKK